MMPQLKSDSLERITLQMTSSLSLHDVLITITQGLVDELHAAFARIWLLCPRGTCATHAIRRPIAKTASTACILWQVPACIPT